MNIFYADIIVPLSVDGIYTYIIPSAFIDSIQAGCTVIVPFAGDKQYTGVVCKMHTNKPAEDYNMREIVAKGDDNLFFTKEHLNFLLWIAEYYMATPGDVLRAILPVYFRLESYTSVMRGVLPTASDKLTTKEKRVLAFLQEGESMSVHDIEKILDIKNGISLVKGLMAKGFVVLKETIDELFKPKTETYIQWGNTFSNVEKNRLLDTLMNSKVQYKMLCRWIELDKEEYPKSVFINTICNSDSALRSLCDKGILKCVSREVSRLEQDVDGSVWKEVSLSEEQQKVLESIKAQHQTKNCVLLHGITSSGKTEIYIQLIRQHLERGEQVLYMLPEIALTVQIIKRLKKYFGNTIGVSHSGMPDQIRAEMWKKQCSENPFQLILGVRSSIFLPYRKLGLIIVDEEHDASYKQHEPSPRYNARDAALVLGKMYGAKIVLGSATPSFESLENVHTGKYGYVSLNQRYGNVLPPVITVVDVKEYRRKKLMKSPSFSPILYDAMKEVLDAGKQVILFQNRRGYSSYLQCSQCGEILKCKKCDVGMTYYKEREVMICRYCGAIHSAKKTCEKCGGEYRLRTPGTERVEEEVETLFPQARIVRLDMDAVKSKARFRAIIEEFEQGKKDILIGTQMVSKGLDFDGVMLVGVLDADNMINYPDFRSEERAYNMLMQVSGRSGRRGEQGRVIIQTYKSDNHIFEMLDRTSEDLFKALSGERQLFKYPPYVRLIRVELRHKDRSVVRNAANALASVLREKLGGRVCGPAVPEVGRIALYYRIHLLIKLEKSLFLPQTRHFFKEAVAILLQQATYKSVRVIWDVDP